MKLYKKDGRAYLDITELLDNIEVVEEDSAEEAESIDQNSTEDKKGIMGTRNFPETNHMSRKRWSPEEIQHIIRLLKKGKNISQIASHIGRSWHSVKTIIYNQKLQKYYKQDTNTTTSEDDVRAHRVWTDDEIRSMQDMVREDMALEDIAKKLNRTYNAIRSRYHKDRMYQMRPDNTIHNSPKIGTDGYPITRRDGIPSLIDIYETHDKNNNGRLITSRDIQEVTNKISEGWSIHDIAVDMKRSNVSVVGIILENNISIDKGGHHRHRYTAKDIAKMAMMVSKGHTIREIAVELNRSETNIIHRLMRTEREVE